MALCGGIYSLSLCFWVITLETDYVIYSSVFQSVMHVCKRLLGIFHVLQRGLLAWFAAPLRCSSCSVHWVSGEGGHHLGVRYALCLCATCPLPLKCHLYPCSFNCHWSALSFSVASHWRYASHPHRQKCMHTAECRGLRTTAPFHHLSELWLLHWKKL